MDASVQEFWDQVALALRDRISSQDWCSWFASATVTHVTAEQVTVEFINDFAARWVDDRFRPLLEQAVSDIAGAPLRVNIMSRRIDHSSTSTGPHEQLAHAAREAGSRRTSQRAGNVMTDEELRAELAAGDVVPSRKLDVATHHEHGQRATTEPALHPAVDSRSDPGLLSVQQLNERYRFDTFVIGAGNQMVHAAALEVAESPAQSYNPLFIHGATGVGKTHVLHAIGNLVRETRPEARIAYITAEQFLGRFMHAIQQSKTGSAGRELRDRFKAYFRGVDVLLMDDVQFVAGKGAWLQEELFHIFNDLHQAGRQIVLTSDCNPDRIPRLEDRLRTRFAWGLIADINAPDLEVRRAILRKKLQMDQLPAIPEPVLAAIAERITSNVRELEGALTRVVAHASLSNRPITPQLAADVLKSYSAGSTEQVTIERIQELVCERFAVDREQLLSRRKTADLTLPRHIGMYLSRTVLGASSLQVARRFNRKDHSTVLHAERQIEGRMRSDQQVHDLIVELTRQLRGRSEAGSSVRA